MMNVIWNVTIFCEFLFHFTNFKQCSECLVKHKIMGYCLEVYFHNINLFTTKLHYSFHISRVCVLWILSNVDVTLSEYLLVLKYFLIPIYQFLEMRVVFTVTFWRVVYSHNNQGRQSLITSMSLSVNYGKNE